MYYELSLREISNKESCSYSTFSESWKENIVNYVNYNITIFSCSPEGSIPSKKDFNITEDFWLMYWRILEDCLNNTSPQVRLTQWKTNQRTQKILEDSGEKTK